MARFTRGAGAIDEDCLHSCLPGPVDTWNRMLVEMLIARRASIEAGVPHRRPGDARGLRGEGRAASDLARPNGRRFFEVAATAWTTDRNAGSQFESGSGCRGSGCVHATSSHQPWWPFGNWCILCPCGHPRSGSPPASRLAAKLTSACSLLARQLAAKVYHLLRRRQLPGGMSAAARTPHCSPSQRTPSLTRPCLSTLALAADDAKPDDEEASRQIRRQGVPGCGRAGGSGSPRQSRGGGLAAPLRPSGSQLPQHEPHSLARCGREGAAVKRVVNQLPVSPWACR